MKTIAVIPCDNGLGHITRSIQLSNYLKKKFKIIFFANKKKVSKLKINKSKIKFINTPSFFRINNNNYDNLWYLKIKKKIHNLNIDLVISDNLPEAIYLNYKTILIANFFWHEILKLKNRRIKLIKKELKNKNIKIFKNVIFKKQKNNFSIGFYGNRNKTISKKINGLLISFGSSDPKDSSLNKEIIKIVHDKNRKLPLYIEPNYYESNYKNLNVYKANFDIKMFNKIKYAIIKPGFGSLQNCLQNNIITICFISKKYNHEFTLNSNALLKNKLGYKTRNILNAYKNLKKCTNFENSLNKKIYWNGEKKIYNEIIKII